MRQELEDGLVRDFPQIFRRRDGSPGIGLPYGFQSGDGWEPLIRRLCERIMATNPHPEFRAVQVKEKFGMLRFYTWGGSEEINRLIDEAAEESGKTCEACGTTEEVTREGDWILTLCKSCREKRKKGEALE